MRGRSRPGSGCRGLSAALAVSGGPAWSPGPPCTAVRGPGNVRVSHAAGSSHTDLRGRLMQARHRSCSVAFPVVLVLPRAGWSVAGSVPKQLSGRPSPERVPRNHEESEMEAGGLQGSVDSVAHTLLPPPDGPACLLLASRATPSMQLGPRSARRRTFPGPRTGSARSCHLSGSRLRPGSVAPRPAGAACGCALTDSPSEGLGGSPPASENRFPASLWWVRRLGAGVWGWRRSVCLSHGVYNDSWEWRGKVAGFCPTKHQGQLVNKAGGICSCSWWRHVAGGASGGGLPGACAVGLGGVAGQWAPAT